MANEEDRAASEGSFQDALGLGTVSTPIRPASSSPGPKFLGLSASQRLVLAMLLLVAVCILGTMCLLITQRISAF